MKKWLCLENFIYLIIFLLPVYLARVSLWGFPTNALEILIAISFLWWIFDGKKKDWLGFSRSYGEYWLPLGLVAAGLLLSAVLNGNTWGSMGAIKGWFILPLLLVFLASLELSRKKTIDAFRALHLSALAVSLIALSDVFLRHLTYDGRVEAFFNSPNYLAMYLAPGIIVGAIMLAKERRPKLRLAVLASILIMAISLYFTYSYAAWISLVAALMAVFMLRGNFSKRYAAILLAVLAVLLFLLKDSAKFHDLASFSDRSSLASRVMIWRSAGKMLSDNWLWGIGLSNFQEKYLEYQNFFPPYLEWAVPHPHNLFLAFWLYGGLMGIVGFLSLVVIFLRKILRNCGQDEVTFIALGIMICILVHGFLDTTYFKNDLAVIFWLNFLALR